MSDAHPCLFFRLIRVIFYVGPLLSTCWESLLRASKNQIPSALNEKVLDYEAWSEAWRKITFKWAADMKISGSKDFIMISFL